jgi:membrane-bound lytic murein transglycosylase D
MYGVTNRDIRRWNGLKSNKIIAGQTLKIFSNYQIAEENKTKSTTTNSNVNYYKIKSGDTIGGIAELYNVRASDIRTWNGISGNKIVAGKTLKIYSDSYTGKKEKTATETSSGSYTNYTIKRGDNLGAIAEQYGVSASDLRKWNGMSGSKIIAGDKLIIYTKSTTKKDVTTTTTVKSDNYSYHRVKKGETISQISEKYKVSVSSIRNWNNLSGDKIIAGETLKIKKGGEILTGGRNYYHLVTRGESLYTIAKKYNTTIQKIKSLNNLSGSKIKAGQKLKVG